MILKHAKCNLVRGIKYFRCVKCGKHSSNYMNGTDICNECSESLNICVICGESMEL